MVARREYPPGVPCWVETLQPDPGRARSFYAGIFGWAFVGSDDYAVARVRERDVAGVGAQSHGVPQSPAWTSYIATEDVGETMSRISDAGGTVLAGPVDASPAGKLAIVADPFGAVFGIWQAELRQGAQLVDEPSAWSMSALQTADPPAVQPFYADVFGWTYEPFGFGESQFVLCRLAGYVGGTPRQPVPRDVVAVLIPAGETQASWGVDFWIEDADAATERACPRRQRRRPAV
jgi:uncharacterized protein